VRKAWLLLFVTGCGNVSQGPVTVSIPRLRAAAANAIVHDGVVIEVSPITSFNWKDYPELTAKLTMFVRDSQQALDTEGGGPPRLKLVFDDLLMVPLPTFKLRVTNGSDQAVSFAQAKIRLEDDVQGVDRVDIAGVREEIQRQIVNRRNRQGVTINSDQFSRVQGAADDLPLLKPDHVVAAATEWRGYVSFRFQSEQPITRLVLRIENVMLDGKPLPPFRFPFVVQRRNASRACKDGSVATPLGLCPGDEKELLPAPDGPCIQATRMINNSKREQWWIGSDPVANSDLHSTLMSQPESRQVIRRGLLLRGFGYSLLGAGLAAVAGSAVGFSRAYGAKYGPIGISMVSISIVGVTLAFLGSKRTDDAIRVYNEQADAGGNCRVVY
jgi:hypothetical protein